MTIPKLLPEPLKRMSKFMYSDDIEIKSPQCQEEIVSWGVSDDSRTGVKDQSPVLSLVIMSTCVS